MDMRATARVAAGAIACAHLQPTESLKTGLGEKGPGGEVRAEEGLRMGLEATLARRVAHLD
jgi:hypothetical protein